MKIGINTHRAMSGKNRGLRGGSIIYVARGLRTSVRDRGVPGERYWVVGFRVVVRRSPQ